MNTKERASILLVEDDPNLSILLKDFLTIVGYHVILCQDGRTAMDHFNTDLDLCVLDVMMPHKDGFTLAREIKEISPDMPLVFLTAKSLQEDKIKGFRIGCDDYLTKPFSTEELHLRIEAILKRCRRQESMLLTGHESVIKLGDYTFDHGNMQLRYLSEDPVTLTRKESDLLVLLCQNRNQLLPREFVLKKVWGSDDYFIGRSMDVFITKLRKHLKQDSSLAITNVHGVGFRLEVPEER
jgi:DNA-binding response OmpR family regulator